MALFLCDFFSDALKMSCSMYVIVPQQPNLKVGENEGGGRKYPTLYLLHGLSDDHTIWLRRTSIERYAAPLGLAVVMPNVHRSFYTDMAHGNRYWTFVSDELPAVARSFFPLSEAREDNFVAGLSMGGYGAFKLALSHPDRYAAGASLSGALNMANRLDALDSREMRDVFGEPSEFRGSPNDLFHLAQELAEGKGPRPKLFQCCGTEDFLYEDNQAFLEYARKLGLEIHYEEEAGSHEWGYWDMKIQSVLKWLPLKTREGE